MQHGPQVIVFRPRHGLRREEIVRHHLHPLDHRGRRADGFGEILADDAARQRGVFGLEPPALVPDVAADVDEVGLRGIAGGGGGGEGDDIEPVAVAGDRHEFLEVGELGRVLFGPGEEVEGGGAGIVPGVFAARRGLEVGGLEEGGEGLVDGVADVEAGSVCERVRWSRGKGGGGGDHTHILQRPFNTIVRQRHRHLIRSVQPLPRLRNHPHARQIAEQSLQQHGIRARPLGHEILDAEGPLGRGERFEQPEVDADFGDADFEPGVEEPEHGVVGGFHVFGGAAEVVLELEAGALVDVGGGAVEGRHDGGHFWWG